MSKVVSRLTKKKQVRVDATMFTSQHSMQTHREHCSTWLKWQFPSLRMHTLNIGIHKYSRPRILKSILRTLFLSFIWKLFIFYDARGRSETKRWKISSEFHVYFWIARFKCIFLVLHTNRRFQISIDQIMKWSIFGAEFYVAYFLCFDQQFCV